jgi:hypothetical protein
VADLDMRVETMESYLTEIQQAQAAGTRVRAMVMGSSSMSASQHQQ